jgi:hypothetical protein
MSTGLLDWTGALSRSPWRPPRTGPRSAASRRPSRCIAAWCAYAGCLIASLRPGPARATGRRRSGALSSSPTGVWPARSVMPPGLTSPVSSPTRRRGSAPSWSSVTAGLRPPGPAHGVEWRRSRWGWPSGPFAVPAAAWLSTATATPPPISPPGPNAPMPEPRPPSGRPGNQRPWRGRRWPSPWRWCNQPQ